MQSSHWLADERFERWSTRHRPRAKTVANPGKAHLTVEEEKPKTPEKMELERPNTTAEGQGTQTGDSRVSFSRRRTLRSAAKSVVLSQRFALGALELGERAHCRLHFHRLSSRLWIECFLTAFRLLAKAARVQ
eukprot:SAG31_NODE_222_length_19895_cov_34.907626_17_plen_133_part_00